MSLTNWNKAEKAAFDVYTAASEKDVYQVRKDLAEYDFVIIDGAGSLSVITSAAVMVSDLICISRFSKRLFHARSPRTRFEPAQGDEIQQPACSAHRARRSYWPLSWPLSVATCVYKYPNLHLPLIFSPH